LSELEGSKNGLITKTWNLIIPVSYRDDIYSMVRQARCVFRHFGNNRSVFAGGFALKSSTSRKLFRGFAIHSFRSIDLFPGSEVKSSQPPAGLHEKKRRRFSASPASVFNAVNASLPNGRDVKAWANGSGFTVFRIQSAEGAE